jgi:hypothetical protein
MEIIESSRYIVVPGGTRNKDVGKYVQFVWLSVTFIIPLLFSFLDLNYYSLTEKVNTRQIMLGQNKYE